MVRALHMHGKERGTQLKGLVLVDKDYAKTTPDRLKDETGVFEEILCDFDNPDEIQNVLKPYIDRLLAVTCRYESAVLPLRKAIPFLPFIHTPSETSLLWSTDKSLMRDRLRNYDSKLVPKYQSMQAADMAKLKVLVDGFKFPVIVKPADLQASLLVSRCNTYAELEECLQNTFKIIHDIYAQEHRKKKPSVLVEEMMDGDMYSTDAYVTHDGQIFCLPLVKVITAHAIGLPGFYSYRHIIPVGLPEEAIEGAFEASRSAIKALGLSSTTTHIELFLTTEGWKIIEVGARIGGYREALYREAYGVEHFYNDLAVRMGMEPKMPGKAIRHAAGINIYADEEGYIASIEGLEQANKLPSVVYVEKDKYVNIGDRALFANNGGHLIVDGILSNKDPEELEKDVARVRELIKIKISPNPIS